MDFVIDLLISNSYNLILILINCFTTKKYYILYTTNENCIILKVITQLYLKRYKNFMVFYYHLFQIEISSLFYESGKILTKSLIVLLTYLYLSYNNLQFIYSLSQIFKNYHSLYEMCISYVKLYCEIE